MPTIWADSIEICRHTCQISSFSVANCQRSMRLQREILHLYSDASNRQQGHLIATVGFPCHSGATLSIRRLPSFVKAKIWGHAPRKAHFARVCVSRRRQRLWHHCQQLRNLLSMAMPCSVKAYIGTAECLYADSRLQRLCCGSFGERAHSGAGAEAVWRR